MDIRNSAIDWLIALYIYIYWYPYIYIYALNFCVGTAFPNRGMSAPTWRCAGQSLHHTIMSTEDWGTGLHPSFITWCSIIWIRQKTIYIYICLLQTFGCNLGVASFVWLAVLQQVFLPNKQAHLQIMMARNGRSSRWGDPSNSSLAISLLCCF